MSTKIRHLETKIAFLDGEVLLYCATVDSLSQQIEEALTRLHKYEPEYVDAIMRRARGEPEPTVSAEVASTTTVDAVVEAAADAAVAQALDESNVKPLDTPPGEPA